MLLSSVRRLHSNPIVRPHSFRHHHDPGRSYFLKGRGGAGGTTQSQPHAVYPTIIPRRRKNEQLRSFLRLHLLWHRCPCPLDFIHLLGEDGVGAAAGGNAESQMPLRRSAERRCRRRAHSETHSRLWRSTMEESPEQLNNSSIRAETKWT